MSLKPAIRLVAIALAAVFSLSMTLRGDDAPKASKSDAIDGEKAYQELAEQVAELEKFSRAFEAIAKLVSPAVVHIESKRAASFMERSFTYQETGSGVIVRLPGYDVPYVLSNHHVVENAKPEQLLVTTPDGRVLHLLRVWSDPQSDVAVLAIAEKDVATARLGDSDKLQIGHWVLAIGSPFDLAGSITHGIVSGKGRRSLKLNQTSTQNLVLNQDFIQTDAPINPGNSGGPLVNLRGEVVGLNTAIASQSGGSEGVGFSIPINLVRRIAPELIQKGAVTRAYLGIGFDPPLDAKMALKLGLPRHRGAIVQDVAPETPAAQAGLESLDVILGFNSKPVEDNEHLTHLISMTPVGEEVSLTVWRDRQEKKLTARLGDRQFGRISIPEPDPLPRLGIAVRELNDSQRKKLDLGDQRGLLIIRVAAHSPIAQHVEPFDVIDQLDGKAIASVADITQALKGARSPDGIRVRIVRPSPQGVTRQEVTLKP